ncbi:MAG: hypothetical protein GVY16_08020 [Planctomycetes bacterium]|jgi:hypothetical protein|nr:hypothetical protein [Planctomycetota bacterium]
MTPRRLGFVHISLFVVMGMTTNLRGQVPTSAPAELPESLFVQVLEGKKPVAAGVLLKSSDGTRKLYVPSTGKVIAPHPAKSTIMYYCLGFPKSADEKAWMGQVSIDANSPEAQIVLQERPTQEILVKVRDDSGKPFQAEGVRIKYYLDHKEISDRPLQLDDKGEARVWVLSDGQYDIWWPRPGRVVSRPSGRVTSGMFVPKDLTDKTVSLSCSSLESNVFTLLFVVRERGRDSVWKTFPGCELAWRGGGAVYSATKGKVYLDIGEKPVKGQVITGLKCEVRLPLSVASVYDLVPESQHVVIGKAGQSKTVVLVPHSRTTVHINIVSTNGKELDDPRIFIRPEDTDVPSAEQVNEQEGTERVGRTTSKEWDPLEDGEKVRPGDYVIRVWAKDHRLYEKHIAIKGEETKIECVLKPSPAVDVQVTAKAGLSGPIIARLEYVSREPGPIGYNAMAEPGEKLPIHYDPDFSCVLLVASRGYAPKLLSIQNSSKTLPIQLTKGQHINVHLRKSEIKHPILLRAGGPDVEWVSQKPYRIAVTRIRLTNGEGQTRLEPGVYLPIIDLSTSEYVKDYAGRAIVCKEVTVGDTKDIDLVPHKIMSRADIVDCRQ